MFRSDDRYKPTTANATRTKTKTKTKTKEEFEIIHGQCQKLMETSLRMLNAICGTITKDREARKQVSSSSFFARQRQALQWIMAENAGRTSLEERFELVGMIKHLRGVTYALLWLEGLLDRVCEILSGGKSSNRGRPAARFQSEDLQSCELEVERAIYNLRKWIWEMVEEEKRMGRAEFEMERWRKGIR